MDSNIIDFPLNPSPCETMTPDYLPTPLELANQALQDAFEALESLRRITRDSPELLPLMGIKDRGFTSGIVRVLYSMDCTLATIKGWADKAIEKGAYRPPRPTMLPVRAEGGEGL